MDDLLRQVLGAPVGLRITTAMTAKPTPEGLKGGFPHARPEVQESGSMDVALEAWVAKAVPSWTATRREALMTRIGWRGGEVPTLEEIGLQLDLTRERVRQLQVKLEGRLERVKPPDSEPFRRMAQLIADHRHTPTQSAGRLLQEHGLMRAAPLDPALSLLLRLLGESELFASYQTRLRERQPQLKEALRTAKDLTRSVGVACLEWVIDDSGGSHDAAVLERELKLTVWCHFLDGEWFWDPKTAPGRNRLVNVTTKMLAACGPLRLREIRDGLDRNFRLGRLTHLPSVHALRLFFRHHPDFLIDGDDLVGSVLPLDPERELETTDLVLYHILRDAPDGFLDRAELFRQATAAGMNQNTFSVFSSYSPILDNPVQDRWVLRGTDVSPAALEAQRRSKKRRSGSDEWTDRGTLRVTRETPDYWSMVVSVPRALKAYIAGRTFRAVDVNGLDAGRIRCDENGTSWGYSGFLQTLGARAGDVLVVDFDLVGDSVTLILRRQVREADDGAG